MAYGGGFSSRGEDPDYRRESVYKFGNALQQVAAELQGQQDQKKALALGEVQRFFREAQEMPELASTWGPDLARRVGPQFPEVPYLVQAMQGRAQQAASIKGDFQSYLGAVDTAKGHLTDLQAAANQMPDTITIPPQPPPGWQGGEIPGPPQTLPNPAKQPLMQSLQAAQSVGVPRTALNSLTAQQEFNARLYAEAIDPKHQGVAAMLPAPLTGFDPRKLGTGPESKILLYAMLKGLPPDLTQMSQWKPEDQQAVRQFLTLDPAGAEVWKLGTQFQNSASLEATRHQHQIDSEILHNRDAAGRIYLSHQLTAAQEDQTFKNRVGLLDQQGKLFGNNTGDPLIAAQTAAALNQKQWLASFKVQTQGGTMKPSDLAALKRSMPPTLPPGAAGAIGDSVTSEVAMGLLPPTMAATEAQKRALGLQQIMTTMPKGMAGNMGDQATAGAISAGHRRLLAQWIGQQSDPTQYQARVLKANQAYDAALSKGADPMAALQAASGLAIPSPQVRQQVRNYLRRSGPSTVSGGGGLQVAPQALPAAAEPAAPAEEPEPEE
jgi:hypothetical protein